MVGIDVEFDQFVSQVVPEQGGKMPATEGEWHEYAGIAGAGAASRGAGIDDHRVRAQPFQFQSRRQTRVTGSDDYDIRFSRQRAGIDMRARYAFKPDGSRFEIVSKD